MIEYQYLRWFTFRLAYISVSCPYVSRTFFTFQPRLAKVGILFLLWERVDQALCLTLKYRNDNTIILLSFLFSPLPGCLILITKNTKKNPIKPKHRAIINAIGMLTLEKVYDSPNFCNFAAHTSFVQLLS